jgi:DNA-binding GntR family transcriptional regulator
MAGAAEQLDPDPLPALAASVRGSFSTVEDMTKAFIRDAILKGIYRPGQRLQQDAIAEILGVSRMPVRASLRQLESEGLVSFQAHRGATVTALTTDQIAEIYELRILLETFALEKAMERIGEPELAELTALATEMEDAVDSSVWLDQRQRFYARLYAFADRPETLALIRRLRSFVGPYLLLRRVVEEPHGHMRIMELVCDGDAAAAKAWLAGHLAEVSLKLQHVVETERLDGAL